MTSRALINPLPKNSGVSLRATIQNPRPRKYASDADRQKAFRERQALIQVRVAPKAVETFDEIAETLGYSRQEVVYALLMKGLMSLGNWETVGLPVDWQRKMPQFKLPRYEENPTMRKATPAQLAARERFAAMARSGAFKRKKNPMIISKQADESLSRQGSRGYVRKLLDRYSDEGHVVSVKKTRSGSIGIAFDGGRMLTVASARKKLEDYYGITDTMKRRSNPALKKNPISDIANVIYNQLGANRFAMMTGAKNFVAGDNFLMFSIGKNQSVFNKVRITLTPDDLYDVEFFKMNRLGDIAKTKKYEGMYAEQLTSLFTDVTGLYTSLGTMGRRSNPADRERKPRVVLITNPQARTAKVKRSVNPNFQFAVQAQKRYPGNAVGYETVAGFPTKAQAQDYVNALLKAYPKGLTLRIMEGNA